MCLPSGDQLGFPAPMTQGVIWRSAPPVTSTTNSAVL
jgi:hypothetical protein